ncbi:hypothetical protein [Lyngbya aestuarii]|uniref:hypothetical protein n=1 Tax=Lyngbya aestuarii TaxID=118322 RepID=UPI00403DAD96
MSPETPKPSAEQEKNQDELQTVQESVLEEAVDPRDLVTKGGYTKDPAEIVNNPAVTPQMLDDSEELRSDLKRD